MEYFFRCNGNFIVHMEQILHEIDSIWKNYYIIKFPWNKYHAGTNISSQCVMQKSTSHLQITIYALYISNYYINTKLEYIVFTFYVLKF